VVKAGQASPELYTNGAHHFEALVARDDLDLVIIATPWDWHVEMAVAVMKHGKHAAVEVPAATNIEDCWKLVDTSEQTRRHCIMLENCCYGASKLHRAPHGHANLLASPLWRGATCDLRDELFSAKGEGRGAVTPLQWQSSTQRGRGNYMTSAASASITCSMSTAARTCTGRRMWPIQIRAGPSVTLPAT
jgi:hypothetical protein